ncbi:DUF916 and DUF3324 domain-containing protein [Latilactobacillus curvatus]|uniref:DUF916 and DUF3324 domain-containing protein n=1 Tax=Latilactobacillus curvatus TaxID=28038 RepID=UPI0024113F24|nr:DUF916 and DUF3324 domain-containing protein [Latilactobacillus curvatus]MDG2980065.1 DUF916 and DUF3324 domain-containing protein [Latilactobacillus curvatus]
MKWMHILQRISVVILMGGIALWLNTTTVQAADQSMNYQVKANLPSSQNNQSVTYFDLRLAPNQEETISITVQNNDNQAHIFNISPNTAVTNQNGVVDYSQSKKKADETAPANIASLITGDKKVTVPAHSSKDAIFKIKMPAKKFHGTLLGGFNIVREGQPTIKKQKNRVTLRNQFAYVIGLKVTESDAIVAPNLKLNHIKAGLVNYRTAITANLQNTKAVMIRGLKVDAVVTKLGSDQVLHRTVKSDLAMAPNSNFEYAINWDNEALKPGKYMLKLTATDKSGGKWYFTSRFSITEQKAHQANDQAVDLQKTTINWWYIIGGILLVLLVGYIIFLKRQAKKA